MPVDNPFLAFLGWAAVLNFGVLLMWTLFLWLAHDWVYGIQRRFVNVAVEQFDAFNYCLIGFYKIMIILLFVTPYLALRIAA